MMGVPALHTRLLARPEFTPELVAHMRLFVSGSAPLSAETHKEFQARTGHRILERYGMTETNMNISNPYEDERIAGSVGLPLPGVEIRIADLETGRARPQSEVGVIEICRLLLSPRAIILKLKASARGNGSTGVKQVGELVRGPCRKCGGRRFRSEVSWPRHPSSC